MIGSGWRGGGRPPHHMANLLQKSSTCARDVGWQQRPGILRIDTCVLLVCNRIVTVNNVVYVVHRQTAIRRFASNSSSYVFPSFASFSRNEIRLIEQQEET